MSRRCQWETVDLISYRTEIHWQCLVWFGEQFQMEIIIFRFVIRASEVEALCHRIKVKNGFYFIFFFLSRFSHLSHLEVSE